MKIEVTDISGPFPRRTRIDTDKVVIWHKTLDGMRVTIDAGPFDYSMEIREDISEVLNESGVKES